MQLIIDRDIEYYAMCVENHSTAIARCEVELEAKHHQRRLAAEAVVAALRAYAPLAKEAL